MGAPIMFHIVHVFMDIRRRCYCRYSRGVILSLLVSNVIANLDTLKYIEIFISCIDGNLKLRSSKLSSEQMIVYILCIFDLFD